MSSINVVPAYATVGLDSSGLMALAIVTIIVLGGVTAVIKAPKISLMPKVEPFSFRPFGFSVLGKQFLFPKS